jgi:predicted phage-related endonuclease
MQEAARGETDRYRVSWATAERKSFDSKSFMKDHPELNFEKYYKTSSYRTFKVAENRI